MKFLLVCAVVLGVATGASGQTNSQPATNRLEGQIYITKKDRETVKMSLVTVRIVDAEKFKETKARALDYKMAKRNDEAWRERAESLVKAMPRMSPKDRVVAMKTYNELAAQIKTNMSAAALGSAGFFKILESFDDSEWKTERLSQTDADVPKRNTFGWCPRAPLSNPRPKSFSIIPTWNSEKFHREPHRGLPGIAGQLLKCFCRSEQC
jgi:hypothetical protein